MENNFYKNLFRTCILSFYSILMNAQQWVWHEIEEENDGGSPVNGLIVLVFIFGVIWLFSNLFGDKNEPNRKSFSDNKAEFEENLAVLEYRDFTKKCTDIYGEYATATFGLVLIKEDGEYRQIASLDKRYEILSSYIFKYHRERHSKVSVIGDFEVLSIHDNRAG